MKTCFPESDFQLILDFIARKTGINLPDTNYRNVKRFLDGKMTELDTDIPGYIDIVNASDPEYDQLINVITINETYFFREEKHFTVLDRYLLPELFSRAGGQYNFWSAACSTGEEALSLAAVIHKHRPDLKGITCNIYATDISPYVISLFKQGRYPKNSFRRDGSIHRPLLARIGRQLDEVWVPEPQILKAIKIRQVNLCLDTIENFPETFDIIFFRNTFIYMHEQSRQSIIDRMVRRLAEKGVLFMSMSETALVSHPGLQITEQDKVYFFRKMTDHREEAVQTLPGRSRCQNESEQTGLPGDAELPDSISTADIYQLVNAKLNNSHALDDSDPGSRIAKQILEIVKLINANQLRSARENVRKIEQVTGPNEITLYFYGYLDMISGDITAGITRFREAVLADNSFWLARFYLAKLLAREAPNNARREFMICSKHIKNYIDNNGYDYQFLLEGFNARYFETICKRWLDGFSSKE